MKASHWPTECTVTKRNCYNNILGYINSYSFLCLYAVYLQERPPSPAPSAPDSPSPLTRSEAPPPPEDIYANPPTITQTFLSGMNSEISDPKLRNAQFGPGQLGLAAGALAFGLVFLVVSGGDYASSKRYKGIQPSIAPPDAIEEGILKTRMAQLESVSVFGTEPPASMCRKAEAVVTSFFLCFGD